MPICVMFLNTRTMCQDAIYLLILSREVLLACAKVKQVDHSIVSSRTLLGFLNMPFPAIKWVHIQLEPTCSSDCWTLAAADATCSSRKDSSISDVPLQMPLAHSSRSLSSASRLYTAPAATYTCSTFNTTLTSRLGHLNWTQDCDYLTRACFYALVLHGKSAVDACKCNLMIT